MYRHLPSPLPTFQSQISQSLLPRFRIPGLVVSTVDLLILYLFIYVCIFCVNGSRSMFPVYKSLSSWKHSLSPHLFHLSLYLLPPPHPTSFFAGILQIATTAPVSFSDMGQVQGSYLSVIVTSHLCPFFLLLHHSCLQVLHNLPACKKRDPLW